MLTSLAILRSCDFLPLEMYENPLTGQSASSAFISPSTALLSHRSDANSIDHEPLKKKSSQALNDYGSHASKTNIGNTKVVMALLSEMWIVHIAFILGGTYLMTFVLPQNYLDDVLWNRGCYWKLGMRLNSD